MEVDVDLMQQQGEVFARMRAERADPRERHDYPGVNSYYDLPYAVVPGFRPLVLDLHLPQGAGPFPVLLWVHGGGWSGGSRESGHAVKMASHGYAVAAAQYRLSGEAKFPAQLHDVKGAVRWLRANAANYQLDAHHVAGWGASAGAHLVVLAALTAGQPALEGDVGGNLDYPSTLQAVIDYFGATDLVAMAARPVGTRPGNPVTELLGYPIGERLEEARGALPLSQVHAGAPPFLILHGDIDPVVPHAQSEALHAALTAAGTDSTLITLPGALHEGPAFWSGDTLGQVRAFLGRVMPPAVVVP